MSTPGSPLALEFAAVEKRYGETVALAATSIAVEKGEFVALLGPSGSGKTTALMIWAGFVDPSAGIVRVGGSDMSGVLPHQRDLGMVFQNYALFPHMTVAQNVGFPLEMRRTPRAARSARVAELLELVRLDALASRFPRELSGGQQQRVALARALASSPPAILLDEPLGALDRRLRDEMQLEFRRLHRQTGATMVYVTHDQSEALSMADRVVVMREGRVEQIGNPEEVYERPRSAFVAGFLGEANFFRGRVTHSQGDVLSVSSEHGAELRVHAAPALPAGSDTLVIVRPERISLMDADAAGAIVRGRLVDAAYAGSERRYRFVLAGGQEVLVSAHVAGARAVAVGEEVGLGWADDAARVVQA